LVVKEWEGEVLLGTRDFEAIPTGTSTIVQLALDSYDMDTSLEIDIDGDGTVDGVVSAQTDTVISTSVVVPEDAQVDIQIEERQSGSQTTATRLSRTPQNSTPIGQVAGVSISAEEQWYYGELLKILEGVADLLALIEEQYEK
jgi:cytoskeletal protein CcmA (bactofilin family)